MHGSEGKSFAFEEEFVNLEQEILDVEGRIHCYRFLQLASPEEVIETTIRDFDVNEREAAWQNESEDITNHEKQAEWPQGARVYGRNMGSRQIWHIRLCESDVMKTFPLSLRALGNVSQRWKKRHMNNAHDLARTSLVPHESNLPSWWSKDLLRFHPL